MNVIEVVGVAVSVAENVCVFVIEVVGVEVDVGVEHPGSIGHSEQSLMISIFLL